MYGQSVVCREHSPCYTPGQRRRLDKIPKEEVVPCGIGEGRMKLNFAKLFTLAHMLDVGLYLSRGARSRALWGDQLCAFFARECQEHDSASSAVCSCYKTP